MVLLFELAEALVAAKELTTILAARADRGLHDGAIDELGFGVVHFELAEVLSTSRIDTEPGVSVHE